MKCHHPFELLLRIVLALAKEPLPAQVLLQQHGISDSTLRRALRTSRELGADIRSQKIDGEFRFVLVNASVVAPIASRWLEVFDCRLDGSRSCELRGRQ